MLTSIALVFEKTESILPLGAEVDKDLKQILLVSSETDFTIGILPFTLLLPTETFEADVTIANLLVLACLMAELIT